MFHFQCTIRCQYTPSEEQLIILIKTCHSMKVERPMDIPWKKNVKVKFIRSMCLISRSSRYSMVILWYCIISIQCKLGKLRISDSRSCCSQGETSNMSLNMPTLTNLLIPILSDCSFCRAKLTFSTAITSSRARQSNKCGITEILSDILTFSREHCLQKPFAHVQVANKPKPLFNLDPF